MKKYDSKNRPVKKIKLRLRLGRGRGVLSCVVCVFFLSFVFSLPLVSNRVCDMPESLSAVKARVVREQSERTCKRVKELRAERENIIRETIEEVRVRVREEQRLRTEERVSHWNKVDNWLRVDSRRVWIVRVSSNVLHSLSFGEVNWDKYVFLLSSVHDRKPRLGSRAYLSHWKKEWWVRDVDSDEGSSEEGPH